MNKVRLSIFSKIFAVLTGLVFINMSFFLTEIRILNLDVTDHQLVENIVKIISGGVMEEEKDAMGESSEAGSAEQIIDLHVFIESDTTGPLVVLSTNRYALTNAQLFSCLSGETATPPPKLA